MVDGLFVEEDAKLIKKIPLSQHVAEDTLYWPYSTLGTYTCKSGYRFLKEDEELQLNFQTPPICHKKVWKEVWHMQAPPKIKNFLWRACRDVLPTKKALMHRKILEDPICDRCKMEVEDLMHAVWSCPELDVVWADQEKWGFRCDIEFTSIRELLSWMIEDGKSLELLAFTGWMVWNQRNKARLNLSADLLHQIPQKTAALLAHFRSSTVATVMQSRNHGSGGIRWSAPPAGLVKVNFDGAVAVDSNKSGIGVVIRDSNGAVLASCSDHITQAYKAEETEVLAARKALLFAHKLGFHNVILEGDALGVIQALKSQEQYLCPLGLLVEDVKIYSSHFRRVLYSHVKRNNNSVAHNLAKHAIIIPDFQVWMEDVPSHIVSILHSDVTRFH